MRSKLMLVVGMSTGLLLAAACGMGRVLGTNANDDGGAPEGMDASVMADDVAASAQVVPGSTCMPGAELTGGTYDVNRSKFYFGGPPSVMMVMGETRYTGPQGVMVITPNGAMDAVPNATNPALTVADWSEDAGSLTAHVVPYLESFGIDPCQASPTIFAEVSMSGSMVTSHKRTVVLERAIDGIKVDESLTSARVNANDDSDQEEFYWPTVPATVVHDARALRDQLAVPAALAAYQAKLPANAQGPGAVVIHHTPRFGGATIHAVATWDVNEMSFDKDGNPVDLAQL